MESSSGALLLIIHLNVVLHLECKAGGKGLGPELSRSYPLKYYPINTVTLGVLYSDRRRSLRLSSLQKLEASFTYIRVAALLDPSLQDST